MNINSWLPSAYWPSIDVAGLEARTYLACCIIQPCCVWKLFLV